MATKSTGTDESALEQGTPQPDKVETIETKRTTKERASEAVGDYPARPYGEAITDEHRAYLADNGIQVTDE